MKHMILKTGEYAEGIFVPEGATIIDSPQPSLAHQWDGSKWVFDKFTDKEAVSELRFQRNKRLAETDWMANSDVIMSEDFKIYRQALRDITDTYTPVLDKNRKLTGMTWPTKP